MTSHRPVTEFSVISAPVYSVPPNGCVAPVYVRHVTEYTVYAADYYGKGEKLYMKSQTRILNAGIVGPAFNLAEDGHPERIAAVLSAAGVAV